MPARPSYRAGKFALQLDGVAVGFVASVEGGEPFGPVVEEPPVGVRVGKHVLAPRYAPLVVEVGAAMDPRFRDWIAAMLDGTQTPHDGEIAFVDYSMSVRSVLEFKAALITEVGFPAADASSKDVALLRVTMQPESTRMVAGSGSPLPAPPAEKANKSFLPSNFRFTISGLPVGNRVAKVAPILVRARVVEDESQRDRLVSVGPLAVSDLVCWLPESEVSPLSKWFDEFVMKGKNDASDERTASLAFVDPTMTKDLMRLDFEGVGIHRISRERHDARAEAIARVKVEMYCEAVKLARPRSARTRRVDQEAASRVRVSRSPDS